MRRRAWLGIVAFAPAFVLVILSCVGDDPAPAPTSNQGLLDGPCLPNGGCNFPDLVCRGGVCKLVEDSGGEVDTGKDTGNDSSTSKDSASDVDANGPQNFRAMLVASPFVTTGGQGTALLTLHPNGTACGKLAWEKVNGFTAAHVHEGTVTDAGGVITQAVRDGGLEAATITWSPTADQVMKLKTEGLYVDIHTNSYPGPHGEIRGQIKQDQGAGVQPCP